MAEHRPLRQRADSFRDMSTADLYNTGYNGAAGNIDHYTITPTIHFDTDGFEDIRLSNRPTTALPVTRNGLGSRLLSTLQTGSPTATALHSRAKSWAAYVPKLKTSNSSSPETKARQPNKIFGDLFNGDSAPVQLGVPTSPTREIEEEEFVMEYKPSFTERPERPTARNQRRDTAASTASTTSTKAAKTSWFSRKPSTPAPAAPTVSVQDEFSTLNINSSLFPHGPADPLEPQSFNDLLLNATDLIKRMQASYKEKLDYISNIQPELEAQKEEVEESQTRSRHLKLQLKDIGLQAEEQHKLNKELLTQLSQSKIQLSEAREAAKTVRLVRRSTNHDHPPADEEQEDAQRRRKRGSAGSASDSGFESETDTSSIFSSGLQTPVSHCPQYTLTTDYSIPTKLTDRQMYSRGSVETPYLRVGRDGEAWTTVERLRSENRELRVQMEDMQRGLQGCIDFVGGVDGS